MEVTPHFRSEEWDQPARYGLPLASYPEDWITPRLLILCDLLEVLREYLICPIQIISGYRTEAWNNLHIEAGHNAAKGSMHIHGVAADIKANSFLSSDVYASILKLHKDHRLRIGGVGLYSSFVHVDVRYILPGMPQGIITWKG